MAHKGDVLLVALKLDSEKWHGKFVIFGDGEIVESFKYYGNMLKFIKEKQSIYDDFVVVKVDRKYPMVVYDPDELLNKTP